MGPLEVLIVLIWIAIVIAVGAVARKRIKGRWRSVGIALLVAAVALVPLVIIFLSDSGQSDPDQKAMLEADINEHLPIQYKQLSGETVAVNGVTCVELGGQSYECVARIRPTGGDENGAFSMAIDASCDSSNCIWRGREESDGEEGAEESEDSSERALEPKSGLAWAQVTCGELAEAAEAEERQWLRAASEAVAYEAIASLPNANEERLVILAAKELVLACGDATNPGYQPFETAANALLIKVVGG